MPDARPLVRLRRSADLDDGTGVRFPPGLGLVPPRDFALRPLRRLRPRAPTEWAG